MGVVGYIDENGEEREKLPTPAGVARIAASAVERRQGPGYPSWRPGLSLLEEEIQHVRLEIVRAGVDGRCAELGRDVQ